MLIGCMVLKSHYYLSIILCTFDVYSLGQFMECNTWIGLNGLEDLV